MHVEPCREPIEVGDIVVIENNFGLTKYVPTRYVVTSVNNLTVTCIPYDQDETKTKQAPKKNQPYFRQFEKRRVSHASS